MFVSVVGAPALFPHWLVTSIRCIPTRNALG